MRIDILEFIAWVLLSVGFIGVSIGGHFISKDLNSCQEMNQRLANQLRLVQPKVYR